MESEFEEVLDVILWGIQNELTDKEILESIQCRTSVETSEHELLAKIKTVRILHQSSGDGEK